MSCFWKTYSITVFRDHSCWYFGGPSDVRKKIPLHAKHAHNLVSSLFSFDHNCIWVQLWESWMLPSAINLTVQFQLHWRVLLAFSAPYPRNKILSTSMHCYAHFLLSLVLQSIYVQQIIQCHCFWYWMWITHRSMWSRLSYIMGPSSWQFSSFWGVFTLWY